MTFLSKEALEKLATQRLLSYKRKWFNSIPFDLPAEDYDAWYLTRDIILSILSTREHITRLKRGPKHGT